MQGSESAKVRICMLAVTDCWQVNDRLSRLTSQLGPSLALGVLEVTQPFTLLSITFLFGKLGLIVVPLQWVSVISRSDNEQKTCIPEPDTVSAQYVVGNTLSITA